MVTLFVAAHVALFAVIAGVLWWRWVDPDDPFEDRVLSVLGALALAAALTVVWPVALLVGGLAWARRPKR